MGFILFIVFHHRFGISAFDISPFHDNIVVNGCANRTIQVYYVFISISHRYGISPAKVLLKHLQNQTMSIQILVHLSHVLNGILAWMVLLHPSIRMFMNDPLL